MTNKDTFENFNDHDHWLELIPWYVKGKLSALEQAEVKQHLDSCAICRKEVADCAAFAAAPLPISEWQPSPAHFNKLMAALDELEATENKVDMAAPSQSSATLNKKPGFFKNLVNMFSETPALVRWGDGGGILCHCRHHRDYGALRPVYNADCASFETLSNAEPGQKIVANTVRIVFSGEMTVKEQSELLSEAKAQVRQGHPQWAPIRLKSIRTTLVKQWPCFTAILKCDWCYWSRNFRNDDVPAF